MSVTPEAAEAVRHAIATYARGVDRCDAGLIVSAFWPDAEISLGSIYTGQTAGFVDVAMSFMSMFAATRHDIGQSYLTARENGSVGYETYVQTWHWQKQDGKQLVVLGRYLGHASQRGTQWRLAAHSEVLDWGETRTVDASWFLGNNEMGKGLRSPEDESYGWLR